MSPSFNLSFATPHRSIKNFQSVSLLDLTVICGPNGSGKTHMIEAVANGKIKADSTTGIKLRSKKFDSTPKLTATHVTHNTLLEDQILLNDAKELIEALELLFATNKTANIHFNNAWQSLSRETIIQGFKYYLELSNQPQFNQHDASLFAEAFDSTPDLNQNKRNRFDGFRKFVPIRAINHLTSFNEIDMKAALYEFIQYQTFMEVDVSKIFYRYFEEQQNNAYLCSSGGPCLSSVQFIAKFGNPPWEEVNALLRKYSFRHQLLIPSKENDARATKGFTAKIISDEGDMMDVTELSSGEKVIIALLLSAYAAKQNASGIIQIDIPDIILFDELDAHLHPSMTRMMFEVIQNDIIGKLSSRVIMSTHSPSTVALAPIESIYRLSAGSTHKLEHVDRATACKDLSDGFIQILDGSQIVIVEGKDDPLFYRAIERALRTNKDLIGIPTLHFIPASKQSDPSFGGGVTSANDWAVKLNDAQLPNIHALLDNDGVRADNGIIKVLRGRYAIENFVLDPLSIAVTLITDARLSSISPELALKFPQVSSLENGAKEDLQELVNSLTGYIEAFNTTLTPGTTVDVTYRFGKTLSLPDWVLKRRGKDVVPIIRETFKQIHPTYVITRKDTGNYDLELGYLLKLWSQYPNLFPNDIKTTLSLLRP